MLWEIIREDLSGWRGYVVAGFVIFGVWLVLGLAIPGMINAVFGLENVGAAGDLFGALNSLVSAIAMGGVLYTLHLQRKEMKESERRHTEQMAQVRQELSVANRAVSLTDAPFVLAEIKSVHLPPLNSRHLRPDHERRYALSSPIDYKVEVTNLRPHMARNIQVSFNFISHDGVEIPGGQLRSLVVPFLKGSGTRMLPQEGQGEFNLEVFADVEMDQNNMVKQGPRVIVRATFHSFLGTPFETESTYCLAAQRKVRTCLQPLAYYIGRLQRDDQGRPIQNQSALSACSGKLGGQGHAITFELVPHLTTFTEGRV